MRTLFIILDCHPALQQTIASTVSGVCWGVILLLAVYFLLRYVFSPLIANGNERKLKAQNFEQQGVLAELKKYRDDKAKIEKEKNELEQALKDSGKAKSTLRQEILKEMEYDKKVAEMEKEMLEEQIKALKEIIKSTGK